MSRQVNFAKDFKPNFSGHHTFSTHVMGGWKNHFKLVEGTER